MLFQPAVGHLTCQFLISWQARANLCQHQLVSWVWPIGHLVIPGGHLATFLPDQVLGQRLIAG